ncbi:hypothetical protein P8C59_000360 [Phyllachora maydis]|uniref:MICOS complex subunit MIC10 n=1 Tax=Phyllachora maydis TaxID=1825666 RepID=A0AAD9M699_9PEZI|nr:hypothetical protein P8C59_000360 [Phyllachora maydis]
MLDSLIPLGLVWPDLRWPTQHEVLTPGSQRRDNLVDSHPVSGQFSPPTSGFSTTMSENTSVPLAPVTTVSRPVSEALLNEKWDRCLSNLIIKSSLGLGFGVVFSVLLFKRRAWPAFVGVGFGVGRAYEECNYSLKQAAKDIRKQA